MQICDLSKHAETLRGEASRKACLLRGETGVWSRAQIPREHLKLHQSGATDIRITCTFSRESRGAALCKSTNFLTDRLTKIVGLSSFGLRSSPMNPRSRLAGTPSPNAPAQTHITIRTPHCISPVRPNPAIEPLAASFSQFFILVEELRAEIAGPIENQDMKRRFALNSAA